MGKESFSSHSSNRRMLILIRVRFVNVFSLFCARQQLPGFLVCRVCGMLLISFWLCLDFYSAINKLQQRISCEAKEIQKQFFCFTWYDLKALIPSIVGTTCDAASRGWSSWWHRAADPSCPSRSALTSGSSWAGVSVESEVAATFVGRLF